MLSLVLAGALIATPQNSASPNALVPPVDARRPLLVTVDDLPVAGRHSSPERRAITQGLLAVLAKHRVPAVGFVIGQNVREPDDVRLLQAWLDAGHELGNHTRGHLSLTAVTAEAFTADAEQGRAKLQEILDASKRRVRFFRFPFLREGETDGKLDAVRRYLRESGQRNVPVTIDDQDWSFEAPFVAARAAGDRKAMERVGQDYLAALRIEIRNQEELGDKVLGRKGPQVLLLHANEVGSRYWGQLFSWLEETGHRFASADEVLADPVFQDLPPFVATHGFGLWHRLAAERRVKEAKDAIATLLETQAKAWSSGELEEFCSAYDDGALFLSPSGTTRGRQAVLDRYRKRYPDRAAMGALTLDVIEMTPVAGVEFTPLGGAAPGRVHGMSVAARWTLRYPDREALTGHTLIVFRRIGDRWLIVQDASM